jgi:formiminoglutamase
MTFLKHYNTKDLLHFFTPREGEKKIGQSINLVIDSIVNTEGNYVLVGIPEDIGPRANLGKSGAYNAWEAFLSKFLSMQSNSFFDGKEIALAGEIRFEDILLKSDTASIAELRIMTELIDLRVQTVIEEILEAGKIPIVIGGGHNNCFPIINSFETAIDVLNIDPHADLRELEGRHSGNGFSYALFSEKLANYFVLGLHEEYNSQFIMDKFDNNDNLNYLSFNQMLIRNISEKSAVETVKEKLKGPKIGLELDLDSIKNIPVSATTPIGFSEEEIRKIIYELNNKFEFHYFHICEGAPTNDIERNTVGKTIAYFVRDFINYSK